MVDDPFLRALPLTDDVRAVPLNRGLFTIVDAADYALVSNVGWYADFRLNNDRRSNKQVYAFSTIGRRAMHRVLLGMDESDPRVVDHINGYTLDNRRINLRPCQHRQNIQNQKPQSGRSSRFKGVCQTDNAVSPWRATCSAIYLGHFETEIEAALAYDQAAKLMFGEFARLNFPVGADVPHGERNATPREFRNIEKFRRRLEKIATTAGEARV